MRRFLGIDYGAKRVGLAVSDEAGILAFPKCIFDNTPRLFDEIGEIINSENVSEIVLGESLDLKGKPNQIFSEIKVFKEKLEKEFNLPVRLEKEFFTSVEAQMKKGKEINDAKKVKQKKVEKNDAVAAALILQRYLDKKYVAHNM